MKDVFAHVALGDVALPGMMWANLLFYESGWRCCRSAQNRLTGCLDMNGSGSRRQLPHIAKYLFHVIHHALEHGLTPKLDVARTIFA